MNQLKIPFRANQEMIHERRMTTGGLSSSQSRPFHTTSKKVAWGPILRFLLVTFAHDGHTKDAAQHRRKIRCLSPE